MDMDYLDFPLRFMIILWLLFALYSPSTYGPVNEHTLQCMRIAPNVVHWWIIMIRFIGCRGKMTRLIS